MIVLLESDRFESDMPAASVEQLPLFTSERTRTWRDLKPEHERRRGQIDRIVETIVSLLPETERRVRAVRLGLPFHLHNIVDYRDAERLVNQHCVAQGRIRGRPALEQGLETADIDEDVVEALRRSYPALIQIRKRAIRHGLVTKDLVTGEPGLIVEPRISRDVEPGDVLVVHLVPFPEYAMSLDLAAHIVPGARERVHRRLCTLAQSVGTDLAALPATHPEAFEIACFRAALGLADERVEVDDLLLRGIWYRRGIVDAVDALDGETAQFTLELSVGELPADVVEAFDFEGIGLMEGDFGNANLAANVEVDELRYRTKQGDRGVRILNRGMSLLVGDDPAIVRISRFLCRLLEHARPEIEMPERRIVYVDGESETRPRVLNWTSIEPIYRHRQAIIKDIADACTADVPKRALKPAARRIGAVMGTSNESDHEMALALESYLFRRPETEPGPIEAHADDAPYPPESEERLVLEAMIEARTSLWKVHHAVPGHGLLVSDIYSDNGEIVTLVDERAGLPVHEGACLFARLSFFAGFAMSPGTTLPMSFGALGRLNLLLSAHDTEIDADTFADLCIRAYLEDKRGGQTRRDTEQVVSEKTPRNAPCPCGSGRKYKHCCWG